MTDPKPEWLQFLDAIEANNGRIFTSAPLLAKQFGLTLNEAREVISYWIRRKAQKEEESK